MFIAGANEISGVRSLHSGRFGAKTKDKCWQVSPANSLSRWWVLAQKTELSADTTRSLEWNAVLHIYLSVLSLFDSNGEIGGDCSSCHWLESKIFESCYTDDWEKGGGRVGGGKGVWNIMSDRVDGLCVSDIESCVLAGLKAGWRVVTGVERESDQRIGSKEERERMKERKKERKRGAPSTAYTKFRRVPLSGKELFPAGNSEGKKKMTFKHASPCRPFARSRWNTKREGETKRVWQRFVSITGLRGTFHHCDWIQSNRVATAGSLRSSGSDRVAATDPALITLNLSQSHFSHGFISQKYTSRVSNQPDWKCHVWPGQSAARSIDILSGFRVVCQ